MDYQQRYELWLNKAKDESILRELELMTEEDKQLAFFKDMEFGTAGLRGIVGAGSNRMNIYNVGKVTKALLEYLKTRGGKSIAVSYDSRKMSKEFAELVAQISAYNGIHVYLAKDLMPTPFLSFMTRFYKCDAGVMITASHNPKDYNGYKVYNSDGCQILEDAALEVMELAKKCDPFDVGLIALEDAVELGLVKYTDNKVLDAYIDEVRKVSTNKIENISILYSALNGTGIQTIPQVLEEQGAKIILNQTQCKPDENFTTCPYPNPEKFAVYESSLELVKNIKTDLIIASDPDADRLGVLVNHHGKYIHLSGNEIGVIIEDFLLSNRNTPGGIVVKSVVSTDLANKIAAKYGGKCKEVLTGFKYIGEYINKLEESGKGNDFVLGFEESFGYLIGTYVRDKDATVAAMMVCEIASELKKQGKTIVDRLNEIYEEFGYYEAFTMSFKFEGSDGDAKMQQLMCDLRKNPPINFADLKVLNVKDYINGIDCLPKANLISYELEENTRVMIRPSGTEPLIKVYLTLTKTKEINAENNKKLQKCFADMFK